MKQVLRLYEVIFLWNKQLIKGQHRKMARIDFFCVVHYFEPWRQATVICCMWWKTRTQQQVWNAGNEDWNEPCLSTIVRKVGCCIRWQTSEQGQNNHFVAHLKVEKFNCLKSVFAFEARKGTNMHEVPGESASFRTTRNVAYLCICPIVWL
jgi:hypothetical protein